MCVLYDVSYDWNQFLARLRSKMCRAKTTFDVLSKKTRAEKERYRSNICPKVVFEAYSASASNLICSKCRGMGPFFEQNTYLILPFLLAFRLNSCEARREAVSYASEQNGFSLFPKPLHAKLV
jgi:hypothetical protein